MGNKSKNSSSTNVVMWKFEQSTTIQINPAAKKSSTDIDFYQKSSIRQNVFSRCSNIKIDFNPAMAMQSLEKRFQLVKRKKSDLYYHNNHFKRSKKKNYSSTSSSFDNDWKAYSSAKVLQGRVVGVVL